MDKTREDLLLHLLDGAGVEADAQASRAGAQRGHGQADGGDHPLLVVLGAGDQTAPDGVARPAVSGAVQECAA
ncbi:hypothetical protein NOSIN_26180 [Nocardiopsis sinuspersici]|uniref:Uncharacterized protein n=1 Tax=Nocardiopsis sinuspersici TaxID=501010 RepID=A0A1V3BU98_9ACTN|nr:hypothetical protein NOSIN_26180 [Nocardiopsis sinuspersici]